MPGRADYLQYKGPGLVIVKSQLGSSEGAPRTHAGADLTFPFKRKPAFV